MVRFELDMVWDRETNIETWFPQESVIELKNMNA